MSKLIFSSIVTFISIISMVGLIIYLSMSYSNTYDLNILILTIIFINLVSWILSPMLMDIVNFYIFKQTPVEIRDLKANYPYIYEIIEEVSREYNFNFPKFFIIEDMNPTAFTYGSGRFNARIVVSQGVFKYLNKNEIKSVIAHELGHIVNRDFIVMMIATTLLEILYVLYDVFTKKQTEKIISDSKKNSKDPLIAIGLLSYLFYIIGTYLILYLSRTREYLADNFAATKTNPEDLANALIKLAYGIISEEDTDATHRLLGATRSLGIIDVENSKQLGTTSFITNYDKEAISEVLVYDYVNPWAFISEISSTHPLTAKRIQALSDTSSSKKKFSYDIEGTVKKLNIDFGLLYSNFSFELIVTTLPITSFILGFVLGVIFNLNVLALAFIFSGIGSLLKTSYCYSDSNFQKTTILNCMRNVYASPVKGMAVNLNGKVIGRGISGYALGEDMMYQDKTGIIFLNYVSGIPLVGNLFFAINKLSKLIGKNSEINGWFFRSNFAFLSLNSYSLKDSEKQIKSYPVLYSYLSGIFLILIGFYFFLI